VKGEIKMTEADLLRKEGHLFTEKQYKTTLFMIFLSLIVSGTLIILGAILAIFAQVQSVFISGFIIGCVGFCLMMISMLFSFRKAYKIQLFRRYQKKPEDFEKEIL
jgi:predicted neutral ceramidase superfamily lipid hydrolase